MRPSVLIVEDDLSIRETMRLALEFEGYQVSMASEGGEALQLLRQGLQPCLILLDLMLPGMDGWQFADQVKKSEETKRIPIVLVTAFAERTAEIKAEGILRKPLSLERLLSVVSQYCGAPG